MGTASARPSAPAAALDRPDPGSRTRFATVTAGAVACSTAWLAAAWAAAGSPPENSAGFAVAGALGAFWIVAESVAQFRFCDPGVRRGGGSWLDTLQGLSLLAAVTACAASPPLGLSPALPQAATASLVAAGALMTVAGVGLRCAAIARLGSHFHDDVAPSPAQPLVTDGVYRVFRHPSEVGSLVAAAGIGLAAANPLSLAITAAALTPLSIHRRRREDALLRPRASPPAPPHPTLSQDERTT